MKKLVCWLLANCIAVFPTWAIAGPPSYGADMVQYEPGGSAPASELAAFTVKRSGSFEYHYDGFGRLALILSGKGNRYELLYADVFSRTPSTLLFNGHAKSLPLQPPGGKAGGEKQVINQWDEEWARMVGDFGDYISGYPGGCCWDSSNPSPSGATAQDFINWIAYGGLAGVLGGVWVGIIGGADAVTAVLLAGIGGIGVALVASVFVGGYWIGDWYYNSDLGEWIRFR
jgi:hypothetical protein